MMFEFLLLHGDGEKPVFDLVASCCFTTGDPKFYRALFCASFGPLQPWAGACSMGCIYA